MDLVFRDLSFDIWPLGLVLLPILLGILWHRKRSLSYLLCFTVFSVYVIFALQKTFFPLMISGAFPDAMRQVPLMSHVNLIPFYPGPWGYSESFFITNLQNVILTISFGFGLSFIARVRAKDFIWIAPAVGFGIETAQLAMSLLLRYPYRVIDVNDLLMNGLGVLIGYGLFRVFARLYVWTTERFKIMHWGLAAYVYEVTSRGILIGLETD